MIALNSAVAEQLNDFKAEVDGLIQKGEEKISAILSVLRRLIKECKPIRFDGNGYSDEWKAEAARRGLDCETSCPLIFDSYLKPESVAMFEKTGVMTRKELERDKYIMETERSIANARASLKEMEADCAVTQLIAPVDGEVKILAYKQEGDRIGSNEVVVTITEPHGMIFLIDNSNGYFRYGMNVRMEVGTNSNRVELQGRIVATDILIPEARRQNIAFLEVDVSKLADVKLTRAQAYAQVYYLENVLTVPKEAVTLAGGQYYVTMLIDGTPAKRFINFVKNSRDATLLFDGADEGDLVILD